MRLNFRIVGLFLATVLSFGSNGYAGGMDSHGRELYRDGEIIVKYRDDAIRTHSMTSELYSRIGVMQVKRFSGAFKNFEHLLFNTKVNVADAVQEAIAD